MHLDINQKPLIQLCIFTKIFGLGRISSVHDGKIRLYADDTVLYFAADLVQLSTEKL